MSGLRGGFEETSGLGGDLEETSGLGGDSEETSDRAQRRLEEMSVRALRSLLGFEETF